MEYLKNLQTHNAQYTPTKVLVLFVFTSLTQIAGCTGATLVQYWVPLLAYCCKPRETFL